LPFDCAAGLLLMGGTDVNPKRYNSDAEPETDPPDDARDQVELDLIHAALERDLPILAICRGLQILNVYHGGDASQSGEVVGGDDVCVERCRCWRSFSLRAQRRARNH